LVKWSYEREVIQMGIINQKYLDGFDGILLTINKEDMIIDVNDRFLKSLGYDLSDVMYKTILELMIPDDRAVFNESIYEDKHDVSLTIRFYHKRGAFRYFNIHILQFESDFLVYGKPIQRDYKASMFESKSNDVILKTLFDSFKGNDITDILEFNESFKLIVELIPIDLWIKDRFGRYIFCNQSYSYHTGNTLEEIYLKDDFSVFDEEIANAFMNSDKEAIESKHVISFSFQSEKNNLLAHTEVTKVPLFNQSGDYIGIIGYSVDVTEKKKSEIALVEERQKMAQVMNEIDCMVFELSQQYELGFVYGRMRETLLSDSNDSHRLFDVANTKEVEEKIQLAFKGTQCSFERDVNGLMVRFELYPVKNLKGDYSVLGYVKKVTKDD
jgi:PAS domain S-box-containing protein